MKFLSLAIIFAALLFLAPLTYAAQSGAMEMGTLSCPGHTFDCDNLGMQREEILTAANECIKTFMGIKESILDSFAMVEEKECAVASNSTYRDESGFKVWAVCCIKPIIGAAGCKLSCTRYIDNSKPPAAE